MADERSPLWSHPRSPADLGAFLRAARIEENLTQEALADELGFDRRVRNAS
ncbi:MAG: helix-turn-helix transcriptional regulator, partial [Cellulomonadaceae bacterium]|nr:helix-turn-helix transcriptional regulator [Cellulomonadaceae bacterium]